ncbi:MAG: membrane protein insertion efficiency factor YidD [Nitriliruptoraceae bacterium]
MNVSQEDPGAAPEGRASPDGDTGPSRWLRATRTLLGQILLLPVHLWRSTAALRTPRCRFHPTCSTYALDAVGTHGPLRGAVLSVRRVGRCHPWNLGGIDPVPNAEDRHAWRRRHVSPHQRTSN